MEALHPPTCHQPAAVTQATCRSMGHKLSERAPAIQDGLKLVEMPGVCWWAAIHMKTHDFIYNYFFWIFTQETGKYLIFGDLDIAYRQCSCESSSVCEQIHIYWYTHTGNTKKLQSFKIWGGGSAKALNLFRIPRCKSTQAREFMEKNTLCSSRKYIMFHDELASPKMRYSHCI